MGFVSGSIQFRTGTTTPLATFADNMNAVRALILGAGMQQVSEADWPGQADNFVVGSPSGNDVDLGSFTYATSSGTLVGTWVFRHPELDLYVQLKIYLETHNTVGAPQFPRFHFTMGHAINTGDGSFSGSTVDCPGLWPFAYGAGMANAAYLPISTFPMYCYCGKNGFWIYSTGGFSPFQGAMQSYPTYPSAKMALLWAGAICPDAGGGWCALNLPALTSASSQIALPSFGTSAPNGARVLVNTSGSWSEILPGGLGDLSCPEYLSTDLGVRIGQAVIYGGGAPIRLPVGFGPASLAETIIRLDLDGSSERDFLPVPALGPVTLRSYGMSVNDTIARHAIYLLPASDD